METALSGNPSYAQNDLRAVSRQERTLTWRREADILAGRQSNIWHAYWLPFPEMPDTWIPDLQVDVTHTQMRDFV